MKGLPPPPRALGRYMGPLEIVGLQDRGKDIAIGGTLTSWTVGVLDILIADREGYAFVVCSKHFEREIALSSDQLTESVFTCFLSCHDSPSPEGLRR